MNTITDLGDTLAVLTAADARDLRAYLKDRLGIEAPTTAVAPPPVVVVQPPTPTAFDVVLEGVADANRIKVIRTIRELTNQGLAEAKAMAESYPKVVQAGVDADTAEKTRQKLEAAGAKVGVRPA